MGTIAFVFRGIPHGGEISARKVAENIDTKRGNANNVVVCSFLYFQLAKRPPRGSWEIGEPPTAGGVTTTIPHCCLRDNSRKFPVENWWIMSRSRRPSVTIYDYPEHLNPFNEEITNTQPHMYRDGKSKDPKHKFWTFGRSRKKRSNSFSIKSTW